MTSRNYAYALALPVSLAGQGITLRGEQEGDISFLHDLYVSVRWFELAPTGWPDEAKLAFLASQFDLMCRHYYTHYADSDFGIVEQNGTPIGRLYLHRGPREIRIVDISLLPQARGQGWGGALIGAVFQEAMTTGRKVSIHVEHSNPARRLYDRLGFAPIKEDGPYTRMEWTPPPSQEQEAS